MSATPNINSAKIGGFPLNKFDATSAPTTGDDSADGYSVGSTWIDVTNDKAYNCVDATAGAAVWNEAGGGGGSKYGVLRNGSAGGSGVVILRLATAIYSGTTTGNPTVTTDGTDTILTYNGSGTYTH